MKQVYLLIAGLVLFALVPGCSTFVQEPLVTVKQASLIGVDTSGVDIEFFLEVTNPNRFDISLMGYTYELRIMTLPLSTGGNQETVLFPAGKDTGLRLPVRMKFGDVLEIIKRHPDPDKVPYRMDARLHLDTPLGEMLIPVEKRDTLSIPPAYRPGVFMNRLLDSLRSIR